MSNCAVLYEVNDRVALITLNRPEALNAINGQVWEALGAAIERFSGDPDAWVAVITGAGSRAFCAGADLKAAAEIAGKHVTSPGGFAGIVKRYVDKPIIAAVNGLALGGGAEIAMFCDLVVASEHAQFGLPEVKRGVVAIGGGLLRLPRQIPLKTAMYHILTGESFSADEALQWGLVNKVVPQDQVLGTAMELAKRICRNAPLAVRASKRIVLESLTRPIDFSEESWSISEREAEANRQSEDAKEGPRAFSERRDPIWQAR
ncbi:MULTISPECIES: crotonase/enoyl-CoA hydratase family protein [Pseudomonas]|uniref:crotonase/enoyl-CoA hydratase family protein n=1 Tax=Pseudomonas TaxID=286 RepID=UPI00071EDD7A|nr:MULTISPECIES: crotonase/enoyl-CoA hydratase family protein [Pseudomonas]ALQ02627.1 Enoyl-CoA hydratase [Pseudomonas brassicacearum]